MKAVDSLDKQLLRILGQNAMQSSEVLAKQLNTSSATIRRRLKKLTESGILHIIGVIDPSEIGLSLNVIIAFKVANDQLKSILEILISKREISWVATTTGRFDILARGRFASTAEFSKFLTEEVNGIKGVVNCETFICLDVKKGREIPPPPIL
jgi:Lrp/AsnC family transcriptional regulator, regulator for asnA, asnC and gidA